MELVVPEAQGIVQAATEVYLRHLNRWCLGILVYGSALKGGFIPGCSDVDFRIYLESGAFTNQGQLPLELCIALHRDLAQIDPSPFQYIQGFAFPSTHPKGYLGPVPGAYQMVYGTLPVSEPSEEELRDSAQNALEKLDPPPEYLSQGLLDHGGGKLARHVRFLCTDVWPTLYHMLTLQQENGILVWQLSKPQAIALLAENSPAAQTIHAFYQTLYRYYPAQESVEDGLKAIEYGVAFLHNVKTWWNNLQKGE